MKQLAHRDQRIGGSYDPLAVDGLIAELRDDLCLAEDRYAGGLLEC